MEAEVNVFLKCLNCGTFITSPSVAAIRKHFEKCQLKKGTNYTVTRCSADNDHLFYMDFDDFIDDEVETVAFTQPSLVLTRCIFEHSNLQLEPETTLHDEDEDRDGVVSLASVAYNPQPANKIKRKVGRPPKNSLNPPKKLSTPTKLLHKTDETRVKISKGWFECNMCSVRYRLKSVLTRHKRKRNVHNPRNRPVNKSAILSRDGTVKKKCDHCGKYFHCNYIAHHIKMLHSNDRAPVKNQGDHRCAYPGCGVKCKSVVYLKIHFITHLEKNPYVCNFPGCNVTSCGPNHLKRHMKRTHFDAPPICSKCGVTYASKHKLKIHKCQDNINKVKSGKYKLVEISGFWRLRHVDSDYKKSAVDPRFTHNLDKCGPDDNENQYLNSLKHIDINAIIRSDPGFIQACKDSPRFKQILLCGIFRRKYAKKRSMSIKRHEVLCESSDDKEISEVNKINSTNEPRPDEKKSQINLTSHNDFEQPLEENFDDVENFVEDKTITFPVSQPSLVLKRCTLEHSNVQELQPGTELQDEDEDRDDVSSLASVTSNPSPAKKIKRKVGRPRKNSHLESPKKLSKQIKLQNKTDAACVKKSKGKSQTLLLTRHKRNVHNPKIRPVTKFVGRKDGIVKKKCDQCGKYVHYLGDHTRMNHSNNKIPVKYQGKFRCAFPNCGVKCKSVQYLKIHVITHLEKNPYVCNFPGCNVSVCSPNHLKRHMKLNHLEAPPICTKCGVTYTSRGKLKTHKCQDNIDKVKSGRFKLIEISGFWRLKPVGTKTVNLPLDPRFISTPKRDNRDSIDKVNRYVESLRRIDINAVIKSDPGFIQACKNRPGFGKLVLGGHYFKKKSRPFQKRQSKVVKCLETSTMLTRRLRLSKNKTNCKSTDDDKTDYNPKDSKNNSTTVAPAKKKLLRKSFGSDVTVEKPSNQNHSPDKVFEGDSNFESSQDTANIDQPLEDLEHFDDLDLAPECDDKTLRLGPPFLVLTRCDLPKSKPKVPDEVAPCPAAESAIAQWNNPKIKLKSTKRKPHQEDSKILVKLENCDQEASVNINEEETVFTQPSLLFKSNLEHSIFQEFESEQGLQPKDVDFGDNLSSVTLTNLSPVTRNKRQVAIRRMPRKSHLEASNKLSKLIKLRNRTKTLKGGFACNMCSARFRSDTLLTLHKRRVHISPTGKVFSCPLCNRMTKQGGNKGFTKHLNLHEQAEAIEKQFNLWKQWPKKPNQKKGLVTFRCKYCFKMVSNHANFLSHMAT